MKCKIPEISWHNRDPVLSVDIQCKSSSAPNGSESYRLASGGTDSHVLIWYMTLTADGSDIELDLAADLSRHQRAVNVVKWSPNGELLASGDDESVVFIWKQKAESDPLNILENTNEQDKEVWITLKVLRGHMEDIYDLSWSPNSLFLVSGSVDNSAIIWDVHKGKSMAILSDHKGFVQGVAWDPKNQYIATLSTDRYLRIFDIQTKRVLHRINKSILPVPDSNELSGKRVRLFHDDTLQTFFRRLSFTPDGKLLITPSGVADYDGVTHPLHTTYAFSRYALRQPSLVLPCPDQYTVAVRCCPLLFRLRPHKENNLPVVPLPYRMIFVVATRSSVYFYDTQQTQPFALISNIHYTRLTDVAWSSDGRIVVVSSTDGFCSLITFEKGELGEEYENSQAVLEANIMPDQGPTKKTKKQKENEPKTRKPSTDEVVLAEKVNKVEENTISRAPLLEKVMETDTANDKPKSLASKHSTVATPIAIKRKPDASKTNTNSSNNKTKTDNTIVVVKPSTDEPASSKPILPADIIIDKEILSSEEKFESPEKKSRPVTPISVRRHPRTPSSNCGTPTAPNNTSQVNETQSPLSTLKQKRANPIAVRRTPRALITAPVQDTKTVVEEAMDAWPLDEDPKPLDTIEQPAESAEKLDTNIESMCERTEDIRLVYEDTVEELEKQKEATLESFKPIETNLDKNSPKADNTDAKITTSFANTTHTPKQQTPNNKTPRRVALKTISTPKSKKKLLD